MRNPLHTVQEAFNLADRIESQIQVSDSFKLELTNNLSPVEVNEISADKTSGDEYEIIITKNKITSVIITISAGKPTKTPELKKVSQVRGGNKKKKIQKLP